MSHIQQICASRNDLKIFDLLIKVCYLDNFKSLQYMFTMVTEVIIRDVISSKKFWNTKVFIFTFRLTFICCCCLVSKLYLTFCNPRDYRLPCPSLSLRACSHSCALSWWCYWTISSSVSPPPPALNFSQHQGLFQCIVYKPSIYYLNIMWI